MYKNIIHTRLCKGLLSFTDSVAFKSKQEMWGETDQKM